jgi:hypothetical protein
MSVVDKIMAYEQGDLDEQDTLELFQELIDSGLAFSLQGDYGRTAAEKDLVHSSCLRAFNALLQSRGEELAGVAGHGVGDFDFPDVIYVSWQ